MAIVSFFTVFVDVGAGFAGYGGNEYVVLSAVLLVAAIVAGGISPLGYLGETNRVEPREGRTPADD